MSETHQYKYIHNLKCSNYFGSHIDECENFKFEAIGKYFFSFIDHDIFMIRCNRFKTAQNKERYCQVVIKPLENMRMYPTIEMAEQNQRLSKNSANLAKDVLVAYGIDDSKLGFNVLGESDLISNNTIDCLDLRFNRKVELFVLNANRKQVCKSILPILLSDLNSNKFTSIIIN